ncbi:MAG: GNAT family N-acetyltransferase [Bacteroidales bacterium]|jgi:ribosomal protein S18 acetylase RimI-like enzyme
MEQILSLDKISFDTIFEAFNLAFGDYEIQIDKDELKTMLTRRGFVPELSFGAFVNDRLVSFTLNGIGTHKGVKTAYDTGTGTINEYQGKGLASRIFTYSLPFLKNAGISQYLLEVLQHNDKAVSVYRKLGFETTREFNYFKQNNVEISLASKVLKPEYFIKQTELSSQNQMAGFMDFEPSWQNSFEAIYRCLNDFVILGAYDAGALVGYCIFEPESGDLTQIAVCKSHRREGIASALLEEALKYNKHDSVKVINTEISCGAITSFIESNGIPLRGKQFEMIKLF